MNEPRPLKNKKFLFLDILTGDRKLRRELEQKVLRGKTYADIMRKTSGVARKDFVTVDASRGKFPKTLNKFAGVIIGGSFEDPIRGTEKAWVKNMYPFIRKIAKAKIPFLGICFGLMGISAPKKM